LLRTLADRLMFGAGPHNRRCGANRHPAAPFQRPRNAPATDVLAGVGAIEDTDAPSSSVRRAHNNREIAQLSKKLAD